MKKIFSVSFLVVICLSCTSPNKKIKPPRDFFINHSHGLKKLINIIYHEHIIRPDLRLLLFNSIKNYDKKYSKTILVKKIAGKIVCSNKEKIYVINSIGLSLENFSDRISGLIPFLKASTPTEFLQNKNDVFMNFSKSVLRSLNTSSDLFVLKRFNKNTGSVGISIAKNSADKAIILYAMDGSPASDAGLKAGDILESIDEKNIASCDFSVIEDMLRGPVGSKVKIEVKDLKGNLKNFMVTRRKVRLMDSEIKNIKNIAYVGIKYFSTDNSKILKKMKRNASGLILDFRFNGGGVLGSAVNFGGYFSSKKVFLSVKNNKNKIRKFYTKSHDFIIAQLPIVIIVNKYTSGSAVMAASFLRTHRKAIIIGNEARGLKYLYKGFSITPNVIAKVAIAEMLDDRGVNNQENILKPDITISSDQDIVNAALKILKQNK